MLTYADVCRKSIKGNATRFEPDRPHLGLYATEPGADVWPNTVLAKKVEEIKQEAEAGDEEEEEEGGGSDVEKETQDIHRALSELRQRAREQSDAGEEVCSRVCRRMLTRMRTYADAYADVC
jgi:hypothetical protein